MALLWLEGFDWIDSGQTSTTLNNILAKRYPSRNVLTGTDAITATGGHGNGMALYFGDYQQYIQTPDLTYGDVWIIGVRIDCEYLIPRDGQNILRLRDESGNTQGEIRVYGDGTLQYIGGSNGTLTQFWKYGRGIQMYLELKVTLHDTTGSYEIRVNGETLVSQTSFDTKNQSTTGATSFRFYALNTDTSNGSTISDIYICDDSGSVNNDFLGPIRVLSLHPDADGDDEDWTLSSGTDSYALVNETEPIDGDSDYIEDTVTTNRSLFTYDDVPSGMGDNIVGVQVVTNPRITDATTYDLINTIKSGGTLYPESAVTVDDQTYNGMGHVLQLLESDPDTSTAWTASGLNGAQFGVEVG
jgi:hypothetical protein